MKSGLLMPPGNQSKIVVAPSGVNISDPWSLSSDEVIRALSVNPDLGLSAADVATRRNQYGSNLLREHKVRSAWVILLAQLKSLIVALLGLASLLGFLFGETLEGAAILAVLAVNTALGFFTEWRAVRSMEALHELGNVRVRVRRDGRDQEINAVDVVPGDIVVLESGDVITADARCLQCSKMQADESTLTGESIPVSKQANPSDVKAPLAERYSMLFKGTSITRGAGVGVVVATGMATELGRISSLIEEDEDETTPLEKRLATLGRRLIGVTLAITVLVTISGILGGRDVLLMIEIGLVLAVAAIPEGLPIVATLALARGIRLMAKRNALLTRLSAVETLGSTGVIFVDKTGTLTENRMQVEKLTLSTGEVVLDADGLFSINDESIDASEQPVLRLALETAVLCNDASLVVESDQGVGDPLEVALLRAGARVGISQERLHEDRPEVSEEPFDPEVKMMATVHQDGTHYHVAVKGAPEAVLAFSTSVMGVDGACELDMKTREYWTRTNERMAEEGLRVLALAVKTALAPDTSPFEDLTFIGLVGLLDPPRSDVRDAIEQCHSAGIQIVMVTGDQPVTALGIARAVGLVKDPGAEVIHGAELPALDSLSKEEEAHLLEALIFARVSPKQKLDLIEFQQRNGKIVAMTGDGVNDAPALKRADIGIAMGARGTQVAREAADMVLQDDSFSSIVSGIEQGRIIFGNIRRFVFYLLSCNVSEVMVVGIATLVSAPLPILPLQVLFLNLVTDVFPALALGAGKSDRNIMAYPPRDPEEQILERRHWVGIALYGALITTSVLGALAVALLSIGLDVKSGVTISFLTLAFSQLWHVFNMRSRDSGLIRNEITRNPYVWFALLLCVGLILAAVYVPDLARVLGVDKPDWRGWVVVLGFSMLPLAVGQLQKVFRKVNRSSVHSPD